MNEFKIAVFGCWNTGCKNDSKQKSVADLIKKNENLYKFMVILGDNYYANKETLYKDNINDKNNIKIVDTNINEMKQGFDCLKDINLEKKLIMGNHDIMNSYDKSCSALKIQLKLPWYDIKFPYSYDLYYLKNGETYETILLIYLDTTIYNTDDKLNCYQETLLKSKNTIKDEQNLFINDILSKMLKDNKLKIKNVLFFGHEPLFTFKEKTDTTIIKKSIITDLLDLLFEMKELYKDINFYWICADHHIYQNTEIVKNNNIIKQWIFGTGGGELDKLYAINEMKENENDTENKYTLKILPNIVNNNVTTDTNGINKHGYGEIKFEINKDVEHNFKMIDDNNFSNNFSNNSDNNSCNLIGGNLLENNWKNKYLKYKHKYLNLKLKKQ